MSVTPNFCCDKTKNRGAYTRLAVTRVENSFNVLKFKVSLNMKDNLYMDKQKKGSQCEQVTGSKKATGM